MNFAKRLRFYLIGFSLGVVLVVFFFGPRSMQCSYFPNSRALEEAKIYPMTYSDQATAMMEAEGIDSLFLYKRILSKSKVTNLGTDEVRTKPCRTYRASYREDKYYDIVFEICDKKTVLTEIKKAE
ncbi:MAG: hypothetical protein WCY77_10560 [Weeksellaceae bacterium]